MQSNEEMIAFWLTKGLVIPAVALCDEDHEDHEEEKGQVISDMPFEY
ncbi:hypothetical protein P4T54_23190 [Bacillus mycoides]|nr:hypothetical protein [Bacillus mycoides]MED1014513.1 hypothetical protein [Bacillus mycoides]MED1047333.1 hypothetical protein [Bacillus mycoides]MED1048967.1 hypothetical protein [Bacillus mycoides]UNP84330.1 hypothetical protein MN034_27635 [Bacillus mycoides]